MAVHPIDPKGPEECSRLLLNTFVTAYAIMENYVPGYRKWFLEQPERRLVAAYQDYYRQLQVLQWQRPPQGHWVLKSPAHLFGLGPLLKTFPDAGVIQIHRDPHKVIPSLCSLFAVYQGMASDRVRPKRLGPEVLELCVEGLRRSREAQQEAENGRILDIKYKDLVAQPTATLHLVYQHFGYEFTGELEKRARRWVNNNPKNKHGSHRYSLEQFGLDRQMIDRAFESYCRQYDIGPEGRPSAIRSAQEGAVLAKS
jgi:hypothetical protein